MIARTTRPKRIVLVTSSLGGGGAERVLLLLAGQWQQEGHVVEIVTLRRDSVREYDPPAGVKVRRLKLIGERNPFWRPAHLFGLWTLRRALLAGRPHLVISFIDKLNAAVLLALTGTDVPVVATEHLAPWMNPLGGNWERLRKRVYRRARAVVSPTAAITDWFIASMLGRFETLPYPAKRYEPSEGEREKMVLGVGRLAPQKGFDLLIEAFAEIADEAIEWRLEIAGEGPERANLSRQILALGLESRAELLGQVSDAGALYSRAEIFALPSRHEAFPMVLCEALSAGCCVVAADCPTGPREIVADSAAGVLVSPESVNGLAGALRRLAADPKARETLRKAAVERGRALTGQAALTRWSEALKRWAETPA